MTLEEYREKRRFDKTPEPAGEPRPADDGAPLRFFIQKHNARNLHYDLRLEMNGVLKSWAVPKGPSLDPSDKRLAVHVEDHPMEYGDFEGMIPEGEYGAGSVIVWDRGIWYPLKEDGYESGDLKFVLEGEKLRGKWMLVHTGRKRGDPKHWLWFKERDEEARAVHQLNIIEAHPRSVVSGRSIAEIEAVPPAFWRTQAGTRELTAAAQPAALPKELASDVLRDVEGSAVADFPDKIKPLLPTTTKRVPTKDDWLHEIKYDGYRMLAFKKGDRVRLISRSGLDWTTKIPKLAAELACLPIESGVLDGEVVVHAEDGTTSFQMLQNRIRRGNDAELCYYAFDIVYAQGYDFRRTPLIDRKKLLAALLAAQELPSIRYSQHIVGDGLTVFEQSAAMGVEGIVSKRVASRYHEGRSEAWLKKKFLESAEFIIVGYTTSTAQPFGALIVARHDADGVLTYAGRVGTGFSAQTMQELTDLLRVQTTDDCALAQRPEKERGRDVRWVRPSLIADVEYAGLTGDGLLRFPAFRGLTNNDPMTAHMDTPDQASKPATRLALDASALAELPAERLAKLKLTNPGRIMYPQFGVTKLEVMTYYAQASQRMLPHLVGRPLSLYRCPEGVEGPGFFQKQPPQGLPDTVEQIELEEDDGTIRRVMCIEDAAGLLALVQFSVLEFHIGGSRLDRPDRPDQIVFDLDPDPAVDWLAVLAASVEVRDLLSKCGLTSFVKTSGGKGLHVVVPLRRRTGWDDVFEFSHNVAKTLARQHPSRFVATVSKSARKGKIYIDYLRNKPAATAIAPLSTRARPAAAVAMPTTWEFLADIASGDSYTLLNIAAELSGDVADPWESFFATDQSLTKSSFKRLRAP